jgi:predicted short-subunit dehydrogenase-like oxidoreductase (DUF2520 family)
LLKLPYRSTGPREVASASQVLFLTVPDDSIAAVFGALKPALRRGTVVGHCSGAVGTEAFKGADELRLETLALHPMQTFSSHAQAIRSLPRCFCALEGSARGLAFGRSLVRLLGGTSIVVRSADRPLYHAAGVFAANFQAALFDAALQIGTGLGLSRLRASSMLASLARAALENVLEHGPVRALTGPVARGDAGTVCRHVEALRRSSPELVPAYRELSLRLVELARRRSLGQAACRRVCQALEVS